VRGLEKRLLVCVLSLAAFALGGAERAEARPTYFDTFTSYYGILPNGHLDTCGVCHVNFEGTGIRNPFGTLVEQQLYIGKTITQSLIDVELMDADGDTFTNGDEIMIHDTLPGFSCVNYYEALNPPLVYHTYCEPLVATCLIPHDIRLSTNTVGEFVAIGDIEIMPVEVFNNGSTNVVNVSSVAYTPGADPSYTISGPTAPFAIPVGASVIVDIVYAPTTAGVHLATLDVQSDDPDEPSVLVNASSLGFEKTLAPVEERFACLSEVQKQYEKYVRGHLKEWNACYLDEVAGQACDTGTRDAKILKGADRFRSRIGGAKDKVCNSQGLTASLLDQPDTCAAPCDSIALTTIDSMADCLICQQEAAMAAALTDGLGTAPPDLPGNTAGSLAAEVCQKKVLGGMRKAIGSVQKTLGRCEAENVIAISPVDCALDGSAKITKAQSRVDAVIDKCSDTTGLAGCRFDAMPDTACLGTSALGIGNTLVDSTFGLED